MSVENESVEDGRLAVPVRHGPARLSSALAIGAAILAVLASAPASIVALVLGVFGLLAVLVGLLALESRRLTAIGTGIVFAGVVASGLSGGTTWLLALAALATILAFDLGQNAFSVGTQLSTSTETWRGEVVHAAGSVAAGAVTVIVALAIYGVAGGEQSPAALAFVLLAVIVLVWAIRA